MKRINKTWMIAIAAVLLLAMAIPAVAAVTKALKPEQKKELEGLYNKLLDTQKQILQKRVEFGQIDKTQGEYMADRLELKRKYMDQWIENGGSGFGMGPGGMMGQGGMMGRGRRGMMGPGTNGCPYYNGTQTPPTQGNN